MDNAVIDAWHSTVEFELRRIEQFTTKAQARASTWIEEYNRDRRHSALGMRSPLDYERTLREHPSPEAAEPNDDRRSRSREEQSKIDSTRVSTVRGDCRIPDGVRSGWLRSEVPARVATRPGCVVRPMAVVGWRGMLDRCGAAQGSTEVDWRCR